MSLGLATKKMFAEELTAMIREMPFEKVRVNTLCERCGADRRTFYYHFFDKYDLVSWIFLQDYHASAKDQKTYSLEQSIQMMRKMDQKKDFYRSVYSDQSQNAIRNYIFQYFFRAGEEALKVQSGIDRLPAETDYALRAYTYACIDLTFEWLKGELPYSPDQLALLQFRFMPEELKSAYGVTEEDKNGT